MAASDVLICNRALQRIGAKTIQSLTGDSVTARACNTAYEPLREALLRKHPWNCAITRASLAADASAPAWGRANAFALPSDYIKLVHEYEEGNLTYRDWLIENGKILTNDSAPLKIRYVYNLKDPVRMDPLFREALSAYIAQELAEQLTESNTKKREAKEWFKDVLAEARRANAFELPAQAPPIDEWELVRL